MTENIARFLLLVLLALLTGTMFGIWVGFNPSQLSAMAYVEQQQNAIRSLNTLLPAVGAVCIVLTGFLALRSRGSPRVMLFAAVALLLVAAAITRFANQPINAVVITWSPQAPPAEWAQLRDQWWQWHIGRTAAAIGGLALNLLAALWPRRGQSRMFPEDIDTWLRSRMSATYQAHLADSRSSTASHLAAMGIGGSTELAHLYIHYGPDSVTGWYDLNQADAISDWTKYAHSELGVPGHFVALTGIEGDGILLYNKMDGSILDVEYGQFEQLAAGKLVPLASSVAGYLRLCMQRASGRA